MGGKVSGNRGGFNLGRFTQPHCSDSTIEIIEQPLQS